MFPRDHFMIFCLRLSLLQVFRVVMLQIGLLLATLLPYIFVIYSAQPFFSASYFCELKINCQSYLCKKGVLKLCLWRLSSQLSFFHSTGLKTVILSVKWTHFQQSLFSYNSLLTDQIGYWTIIGYLWPMGNNKTLPKVNVQ